MKSWQKQLGILFLIKLGYLLFVAGVVLLFPAGKDSAMGPVEHVRWTPKGHPTFESYFTTWDAGHYLYLSEGGYQPGQQQCAFYPLWPLLVRWFSILTRGDHIISGMILANLLSLAGWYIFLRTAARRFGDSIAWISVALLLTFPGSLFFQFIYSESLFFLLVMLLCFGLEENRVGVAFTAAFLLPLTRAVGVFCVFPIALHLMRQESKSFWPAVSKCLGSVRRGHRFIEEKQAESLQSTTAAGATKGVNWWLLAGPLYGWAVYFLLMWKWTGNPFEGFEAQRYWGVQSVGNLLNAPGFAMALVNPTCWHGFTGSALDRCAFVLLLYCLPVIWRLDKVWFAWAIVLGVVPAMSGHFTSFVRFESTVFPLFIAPAVWFGKRGGGIKILWLLTMAAFFVLHLLLLWRFLYFQWAG